MSEQSTPVSEAVQAHGINRRGLLKFGAFSGLAGAAGVLASTAPAQALANTPAASEGSNAHLFTEHDEFPLKVADDYQRYHQERTAFHYFAKKYGNPYNPTYTDFSKPGFTTVDHAINMAAWDLCDQLNGYSSNTGFDIGLYRWDNPVWPQKHQFENKQDAANAIKRTARMFGANLVGITRQDDRWDYASFLDAVKGEVRTWDDFPFKPKTVIALAIESDYEGQSTAPSLTNDGIIGEGYARMSYVAYGVAAFLRAMGYHAVASGNDLGMSVPYAIAAGIGETSRMGLLVTYNMGPRIRLMKVYTDFDFVEYDKPKTFGVRDFCERCKRCADACPSKAISFEDKMSLYPHEGHDAGTNNVGIEKWWTDSKKCLQYWNDSGTNCGTCVTACPYNKPDFWQHRMIEKMNSLMPGPLHTFMREMDIWFGFGDTFDEKAVAKFWSPEGRKYDGRG
ncbi:reductive dehalogenase [Parendozoicomonas haliclonae]|uniref:3-chloro-4-hydroxyphenylacetate reductive dehalogenase n=1 Tax=Parendozoicomonas haliclonae TaxID=1960125 RepID=A0A1X7ARY0_9GAMM|nr:reductive dehalogenase [Parendozoicomonas haliclonae]SMA50840.1 3-chloro-4-hydroxyphenylacetate reductive dehalogenase precursor [Parendozoicomonas haliclonae]